MWKQESWWLALDIWRVRFRDARLGQAAGSLTFTTLIAMVPMFTVVLALFTVFPVFSSFQQGLETYFLQSLIPDSIARPVLKTITQFASKAARLGSAGLVVLLITTLALMLTMDRVLNGIWHVSRPRPLSQRLLIYATAITLGPLAVGVSFTLTSYVFSASRGWGPVLPLIISTLVEALELLTLTSAVTLLYRFVPNTSVRWREAALGGIFVGLAFSMARALLGWYVEKMPTYAAVYGAFATLPILLLWIYIVWVIILVGALLAANVSALMGRGAVPVQGPGRRFNLALSLLRRLALLRDQAHPSAGLLELASDLQADPQDLRPILDTLCGWGWLARVQADGMVKEGYILRLHPAQCPLGELCDAFLLQPTADNGPLLKATRWRELSLQQVL